MRAVKAVLAVAVLLAAAGAQAVPYVAADGREIDVEYWAGTGANQSVLIVDFRQGADDYFAFGYEGQHGVTTDSSGFHGYAVSSWLLRFAAQTTAPNVVAVKLDY